MRRRSFVVGLVSIFAQPFTGDAQTAPKIWRIGVLSVSLATRPAAMATFADSMRELGYLEGRDYVVERRFASDSLERYPELVTELIRLKPDVIIVSDTAAARAAMQATSTIPIVMVGLRDPVGDKLVATLARPGGNVTGISGPPALEMNAKRLALLKEAVPAVTRVAVLQHLPSWAYNETANAVDRDRLSDAARKLGCSLLTVDPGGSEDLDAIFARIRSARAGALLVSGDPFVNAHRKRIAELAARHALPAIYGQQSFVQEGALMRYGETLQDSLRRLSYYIDKIFKGAKPVDLPVEQPTKFELVINLKTAKALGLTFPQSLLLRADQVIE